MRARPPKPDMESVFFHHIHDCSFKQRCLHTWRLAAKPHGERIPPMSREPANEEALLRIAVASPQDVRSWSYGEVKCTRLFDAATSRPAKAGLFCERIFGPVRDWECGCGKLQ